MLFRVWVPLTGENFSRDPKLTFWPMISSGAHVALPQTTSPPFGSMLDMPGMALTTRVRQRSRGFSDRGLTDLGAVLFTEELLQAVHSN